MWSCSLSPAQGWDVKAREHKPLLPLHKPLLPLVKPHGFGQVPNSFMLSEGETIRSEMWPAGSKAFPLS